MSDAAADDFGFDVDDDVIDASTASSRDLSVTLPAIVGAVVIGIGVPFLRGGPSVWWSLIVGSIAFILLSYVLARLMHGRRSATDRLASALVTVAFILVMLPLVSVIWTLIRLGFERLDVQLLTSTMRLTPKDLGDQRAGEPVGGAYHAMIGTLIVTGVAAALSIPLGLFTAIYLVEYRGNKRLNRAITTMVDVMTGIPSIVAGLFAYALFELFLGSGTRSGLAGGVALMVLMTPVVIRSAEEMLRLVPDELREASYALGVPKWRTIVKVVLPTSIAGILTGITLAIARVVGETAPLLVTAGLAQGTNYNPFDGRMSTLPVYTYYSYVQPGTPPEAGHARAWASALLLVMIVAVLFIAARMLAAILKPKGLR